MFRELILDSCSGIARKCFSRLPTGMEVGLSKGVAGGPRDP